MFAAVAARHFFRPDMGAAVVRIGCFSIALQVQARFAGLLDEIADLYRTYPRGALDELPDFTIALRSKDALPFRRQIRAYLNGELRYQAAAPRLGLPMLESALNWLVWTSTTRFLLLHAAVLERHGGAILLPGPPGIGKSTLCAALAARGWRLLSDEMAMVRPADGLIQPHPRPISLKNEAIDLIAGRLPDAHLSRRFEGTAKGTVAFMRAPQAAIDQAAIPARPQVVVFPRYAAGTGCEVQPLEKAQAFMRLVGHSSNYLTLLETGFDALAALVESCDHHALAYGALDDALALIEGLMPAGAETRHVA